MTESDDMRNPSRSEDDPLNIAMQSPHIFLSDRLAQSYTWAVAKRGAGDSTNMISMMGCIFWTFIREYIFRGRVLKGRQGLAYAVFCTQDVFFKYANLYTLEDKES